MSPRIQRVINIVTVALSLIPLVWLACNLPGLPENVPVHFGSANIPDRWGSKFELLFIGIMAPLVEGVCLASQRFDFANLPARFVTRAQRTNAVQRIAFVSVVLLDIAAFYVINLVLANL